MLIGEAFTAANVLLVDDTPGNLVVLEAILKDKGYNLVTAKTAFEALARLLEREFAVILLDVMLPDLDGFELTQLIKASPRCADTPIIFVTAVAGDAKLVERGYEVGAADYLTKPLNPMIVQAKVAVFAELFRKGQRIALQAEQMQRDAERALELRRAKDLAEHASLAKSRFLATMSHEIRTPLGAVLGFAELLKESALSEDERQDYLATIQRNGRDLARLIDDILDLSKVEAGGLALERLAFSPTLMGSDLRAGLESLAIKKGISLVVAASQAAEMQCLGDPARIRQILVNLVGNAIKFTERGGVVVEIDLAVTTPPSKVSTFTVKVQDSGIGITAEQAKALFKPFCQADASTARRFGGTGLGLTLALKLAHAMGGDVILAASEPGLGSTFVLALPVEVVEEVALLVSEPIPPACIRLDGVRVLLVDDSRDSRRLFTRFLELAGARVDQAVNGARGIEKAMTDVFDVVLMDVEMPEMDGYAAASRLRQLGFKKPIIALTAHALKGYREKFLAAGYSDHIPKPVDRGELLSAVASWQRATPRPVRLVSPASPAQAGRPRSDAAL